MGISSNELENMKISIGSLRVMSDVDAKKVKDCLLEKIKNFNEAKGQEKSSLISLISAHAGLCKEKDTPKWKNVHNVLVYKYATKNKMSDRIIARKVGKRREKLYYYVKEAMKNMIFLCNGFPAILANDMEPYQLAEVIICNYKYIKYFQMVDIRNLFSEDIEKMIIDYRKETENIIKVFHGIIEIYEYYCQNSIQADKRKWDVLRLRYIEDSMDCFQLSDKYDVHVALIRNDCRLNINRISELMFKDE